MNLNKYEKKFKEAIALQKERGDLLEKIRSIEAIKLDQPIHHGYVKSLEFIPEVKRRDDYLKIKQAFELCGQKRIYCKNRSFLDKNGMLRKPGIRSIKDPRFSFFYSEEKRKELESSILEVSKYLIHINDFFACNCNNEEHKYNRFAPHYEFRYRHFLQEKIDDHWLTHYTPKDGALESRYKEIDQIFEQKQLWKMLYPRSQDDYYRNWPIIKADAHGYYHSWPRPIHYYENYEL